MAEPRAAARQRRHVGDRHLLCAERLLKEGERIDDPLGAPGYGLLVDEISVGDEAAAARGQRHARGEHQASLAMLQDQVGGHVGSECPHDREGRQHRIERALEADELVAMEDAGAVGDVDQLAAEAEADLGEQPVGVRERRVPGGRPAVAQHHHANAPPDLLLPPAIERGRRRPPEPGDDAADIGGPLRAGQAGADVPKCDDEAEMIERHFGEAVNPGLVGPRFLAAVVDREDFAPHRLGAGFVAEPLRRCRRRQQQRGRRSSAGTGA